MYFLLVEKIRLYEKNGRKNIIMQNYRMEYLKNILSHVKNNSNFLFFVLK